MHRLQVAVDALPLGFVVVDHDERVVLRNAPAEHFLGVRYADALVLDAVRTNLRTAPGRRAEHRRPSTCTARPGASWWCAPSPCR